MNIIFRKRFVKGLTMIICACVMSLTIQTPGFASSNNTFINGKVYEFGGNSEYEISSAEDYSETSSANTYGEFSINGSVETISPQNGVSAYRISDGELSFTYKYDDSLLKADVDSWHLFSDSTNRIDGILLNDTIQNGTILLQTSMDKLNWTNAVCLTNIFETMPNCSDAFYKATDIELLKTDAIIKSSLLTKQESEQKKAIFCL